MNSRNSTNRLSPTSNFGSRISFLMLSMFSTMAALYVAGRLWLDSENRVYLIQELDRRTGQVGSTKIKGGYHILAKIADYEGRSAISVDDTLKIITCREQQKRLAALQMELGKASQEGFVSKHLLGNNEKDSKKKLLAVVGVSTNFGNKKNRDAIRKAWMPTGLTFFSSPLSLDFFCSNRGDSSDRAIDDESRHSNDFIILNDHVESSQEQSKKTKLFFAHAVDHWDAEFYAKVNDNVYINLDAVGAVLASYLDKPRVYIGCMKSGEVFSQPGQKWYEPEWWKFGDKKSYFRHASGEIFAISKALAQFISINRSILRTYAHDDVSAGSWFIGLDVKHVDEGKFCCSSWSSETNLVTRMELKGTVDRVIISVPVWVEENNMNRGGKSGVQALETTLALETTFDSQTLLQILRIVGVLSLFLEEADAYYVLEDG
ncbi:putative beta-1,3-galactosyltransferase 11 [Capsicum annuum]|nr:putative beta-1,3-galactosyltransferase 11 [Capsicum annuum]